MMLLLLPLLNPTTVRLAKNLTDYTFADTFRHAFPRAWFTWHQRRKRENGYLSFSRKCNTKMEPKADILWNQIRQRK